MAGGIDGRYPEIRKLVLDLDNGPENNSHRSQFLYRLVQLAKRPN